MDDWSEECFVISHYYESALKLLPSCDIRFFIANNETQLLELQKVGYTGFVRFQYNVI